MPHFLQAVLQREVDDRWLAFNVEFDDQLHSQIERLLEHAATLPLAWFRTRYQSESDEFSWVESGSRDRLTVIWDGCGLHGWPFVVYVKARQHYDSTKWLSEYKNTYMGWWPSRLAFAREIVSSSGHFGVDFSGIDRTTVDEICAGFLCLEIDGQTLVFDLMSDD